MTKIPRKDDNLTDRLSEKGKPNSNEENLSANGRKKRMVNRPKRGLFKKRKSKNQTDKRPTVCIQSQGDNRPKKKIASHPIIKRNKLKFLPDKFIDLNAFLC